MGNLITLFEEYNKVIRFFTFILKYYFFVLMIFLIGKAIAIPNVFLKRS